MLYGFSGQIFILYFGQHGRDQVFQSRTWGFGAGLKVAYLVGESPVPGIAYLPG